MSPVGDEPRGAREHLADLALDLIEEGLESVGLTVKFVLVSFVVEEADENGLNAISAIRGPKASPTDVLAILISQASGVAEEIGVTLKVVPVGKMGHD